MRVYIDFDENSDAGRYFLKCARIRNISVRGLLQRLYETFSRDQLIGPVLDDSDAICDRRKGEHRYTDPSGLTGDL